MLQDFKSQFGQSMASMRQFLQKPIQLNSGHLGLGVSESSLRPQARDENRKRVRHMKRDLYELLGQHPSSRRLMRRRLSELQQHLALRLEKLRTSGSL